MIYLYLCNRIMTIELHNITIGQTIRELSATIADGQLACLTASHAAAGKTILLRALLGFLPLDEGHICMDGELLTPLSAPYFRRQMAYVPQHVSQPEGCSVLGDGRWTAMTADERYLWLVERAVKSGRPLLVIDEPPVPLDVETLRCVDQLMLEAVGNGCTVIAANERLNKNPIQL